MLTQNELIELRVLVSELETLAPALEGYDAQQAVRTLRTYADHVHYDAVPVVEDSALGVVFWPRNTADTRQA